MLVRLIFLLSIFHVASATGYLRLEFTSSNHCSLRLITNSSSQTIYLRIGETRTASFHPRSGEQKLQISTAIDLGALETHVYELKSTGDQQPQRRVQQQLEIVLLIQATFECDAGFCGERCQDICSTTSTTTVPTTTTTQPSPSLITSQPMIHPTAFPIILFIIAIILFLIAIYTALLFHIHRQPFIIESKTCQCNRFQGSPPRYTAAPFSSFDTKLALYFEI